MPHIPHIVSHLPLHPPFFQAWEVLLTVLFSEVPVLALAYLFHHAPYFSEAELEVFRRKNKVSKASDTAVRFEAGVVGSEEHKQHTAGQAESRRNTLRKLSSILQKTPAAAADTDTDADQPATPTTLTAIEDLPYRRTHQSQEERDLIPNLSGCLPKQAPHLQTQPSLEFLQHRHKPEDNNDDADPDDPFANKDKSAALRGALLAMGIVSDAYDVQEEDIAPLSPPTALSALAAEDAPQDMPNLPISLEDAPSPHGDAAAHSPAPLAAGLARDAHLRRLHGSAKASNPASSRGVAFLLSGDEYEGLAELQLDKGNTALALHLVYMACTQGRGGFAGHGGHTTLPELLDITEDSFGVSSTTLKTKLEGYAKRDAAWAQAVALVSESELHSAADMFCVSLSALDAELRPLITRDSCRVWVVHYASEALGLNAEEIDVLLSAAAPNAAVDATSWEAAADPEFAYLIDIEEMAAAGRSLPTWADAVRSVNYVHDYLRAAHIFRYAARPGAMEENLQTGAATALKPLRSFSDGRRLSKHYACEVGSLPQEDFEAAFEAQVVALTESSPAANVAARLQEAHQSEVATKAFLQEAAAVCARSGGGGRDRGISLPPLGGNRQLFVKPLHATLAAKARFTAGMMGGTALGLSETNPFPSLADALQAVRPFDTINLLEGTYPPLHVTSPPRGVVIRGIGTGAEVLIKADSWFGAAATFVSADSFTLQCVRVCKIISKKTKK